MQMLQKKNPGARIESIFWKKYGRLRTLVSVSISKGIFDRYARLSLFKTHIPSSFIAVRRYSGRPPQCNVLPPLPPASLLPICFALPVLCLHNSSPYELTTHTHTPHPSAQLFQELQPYRLAHHCGQVWVRCTELSACGQTRVSSMGCSCKPNNGFSVSSML